MADTIAFLHWVYEKHPRIPCFLFGHSTGGAVALKVGHSLIFPNVIASYVIQLYLKILIGIINGAIFGNQGRDKSLLRFYIFDSLVIVGTKHTCP